MNSAEKKHEIFEIGSWVKTEDGIGQILYNRESYVEPFHHDLYDPKRHGLESEVKVGDFERMYYVCKIFIDEDMRIKKRFKIDMYIYASLVDEKEMRLIEKFKETENKKYREFILYDDKKTLTQQKFLEYCADGFDEVEVAEKIKEILKELDGEFTYKEFRRLFNKKSMPFSLDDYVRSGFTLESSCQKRRMKLRFDSLLYKRKGKETIFRHVVPFFYDIAHIEHSGLSGEEFEATLRWE